MHMMRKITTAALLAAAALWSATAAAEANIVQYSGSFTARNWEVLGETNPAPPRTPLWLDWSVRFDLDKTYRNDTTVLTVFGTNVTTPLAFSWSPMFQTLWFGTETTPASCLQEPGFFCAAFSRRNIVSGLPDYVGQGVEGGGWQARSITAGTPPVPEPAAWALMITGFGLVGSALRRRPAIA